MSKRILVIDDTATTQQALAQHLPASDYMISGVSSGDQAIELLKTERFDIIVTVIHVPGIKDFGILRVISDLDWDPGVILLNNLDARANQEAREQAMAYSVNVLTTLSKPINADLLTAALQDVANMRSSAAMGTETVLEEAEFTRGLMTDGLAPAFQPKLDLKAKAVMGAEVFARWKTPSGSFLGAGAVVKAANEYGHMDVLTYRMLELAMQQQGRWRKQGQEVTLSINVTSENLRKPDFAEVVAGLADQFDIRPDMVRLEVTESDLDIDAKVPLQVLAQLYKDGFGLALDDFGAGFAPLLKLKEIPFDELVIDRQFLSRAAEDDKARIILEAAIDLAHKLELKCTCEGVETEEHLKIVSDLGADYAQGYLFGKPMSAGEFLIWIEDFRDGVLKVPGISS